MQYGSYLWSELLAACTPVRIPIPNSMIAPSRVAACRDIPQIGAVGQPGHHEHESQEQIPNGIASPLDKTESRGCAPKRELSGTTSPNFLWVMIPNVIQRCVLTFLSADSAAPVVGPESGKPHRITKVSKVDLPRELYGPDTQSTLRYKRCHGSSSCREGTGGANGSFRPVTLENRGIGKLTVSVKSVNQACAVRI